MANFSRASLSQDAFLEALVSSLAIIRYTDEGFITYASQPFLSITGYDADDVVGHPCSLFASTTKLSDGGLPLLKCPSQEMAHTSTGTITAKDGTILPVESTFFPIYDGKGSLRHIVEVCFFTPQPVTEKNQTPAPDSARNLADFQLQNLKSDETDLLAQVVLQSENAVVVSDTDNKVIFTNASFFRMFGYEREEFAGKRATTLYGRADEKVATKQQIAIRAGSVYRSQKIAYSKTGQPLWVFVTTIPIVSKEGVHTHTVSIINDITDIKVHDRLQSKTLEALMRGVSSTEILSLICYEVERIFRDISIGIVGTSALNQLVLLAGPSLPHAVGNSFSTAHTAPENRLIDHAISQKRRITIADTSKSDRFPDCCKILSENGIPACTVFPILSNSLRPLGAITFNYSAPCRPNKFHLRLAGVMTRLSAFVLEREQIRSTMRHLTHYDSLTGLPNRQLILATGNQVLAKIRNRNKKAAILLINLDKFKRVNESMGHLAGDKLLHAIGRNLHSLWNDKGMVGRMASDEFTLIVEISDNSQAENLVKEVQQVVSIPQHFNDITLIPTCCVGISLFPDTETNFESLLQCASLALSQAKSCGVGNYAFFDQGRNKYARMQLTMESALRVAIGSPEIALFYQPQVYIGSDKLHGVEALSRWYSTAFGMVSPSRFIPIAEDSGVILQLNTWLIQEACRQLSDWRNRGITIPTVSINLSAKSFHDQSLIALLLDCMQRYGLHPSDILLELTESVLLDPNPETLDTIHETAKAGFKFSLDDFGTGYSSLSYLRELPISELKLDSSFAKDLETNETNRRLSKAIMGIGTSLGLSVVAEGIETPEQLALLSHQGYTIAQGFLYAQAMPPDQLERWLENMQATPILPATGLKS